MVYTTTVETLPFSKSGASTLHTLSRAMCPLSFCGFCLCSDFFAIFGVWIFEAFFAIVFNKHALWVFAWRKVLMSRPFVFVVSSCARGLFAISVSGNRPTDLYFISPVSGLSIHSFLASKNLWATMLRYGNRGCKHGWGARFWLNKEPKTIKLHVSLLLLDKGENYNMPPKIMVFMDFRVFLNLWFGKPMLCMRVAIHENDGNHENDENNEDNSDSYKQGAECWIRGNHGNHGNDENHGNPGCKPRVPQTTGLEIPEIWAVELPPDLRPHFHLSNTLIWLAIQQYLEAQLT